MSYFYGVKDKFSKQAETYAKYRPGYPKELFDLILNHTQTREAALDCATGNGQTAKELANNFIKVFATDISQTQLDNAVKAENIFYSCQPAEHTTFEENTFDLITVSQALHWLDIENFYDEVKRVAKPGGVIAAWMYSLASISPPIDELINKRHYRETLGNYWDYERKYVDDNYSTIPFPFSEITVPPIQMTLYWSLDELKGYLESWSALQNFISANQYSPVDELVKNIRPYWKEEKMKIIFPLYLRMGKVEK